MYNYGLWGLLPATRLASRKIFIEQNIKRRTGPLPLKNIFRMIPLSAQSISLDSPFNIYNFFEKEKTTLKVCTIEKIAVVE